MRLLKAKLLYWHKNQKVLVRYGIPITIFVGVALRYLVMLRGHNYDFDSWIVVGKIASHGGNVYAETSRYNYGPLWLNILAACYFAANLVHHSMFVYRVEIVSVLTAADLILAFLLRRWFGTKAFILFFLNPISIIITGFHNQMDVMAVLFGLIGAMYFVRYEKEAGSSAKKQLLLSIVFLSLSLLTKHVLFLLPLWFALRAKSLPSKLVVLLVPPAIFLCGFLPYIWSAQARMGIIHNVFLYKSMANAPFWHFMLPTFVQAIIKPMPFFILLMVLAGMMLRARTDALKSSLIYLVCVVVFSSAVANQYLAIPMAALAVFASWWFLPYIVLATVLLTAVDVNGLYIHRLSNMLPGVVTMFYRSIDGVYAWVVCALALGSLLVAGFKYKMVRTTLHGLKDGLGTELRWQRATLRQTLFK